MTSAENFVEEDIPEDMRDVVLEYREKMLEAVAEVDEHLMEKYIEGESITPEEIKAGIRKGTISNEIVPVVCGTAFKNKGVQPLGGCRCGLPAVSARCSPG